jgi:uncharacterized membrane protein YkvA (DUF1232 family)
MSPLLVSTTPRRRGRAAGPVSVEEGIRGVRDADVDAVRGEFPDKFAAVRPLLTGAKLGRLRDLAQNVRTLFELLTDRSFPVPWRTTAAVVFALGYFVLSLDVIPDVIPVLGFLDDALVVAEVVYLLSGELRRYREHVHASAPASAATVPVPEPAPSGERLVA